MYNYYSFTHVKVKYICTYLPITNVHAVLYTTSTAGKSNLKRIKDRILPLHALHMYIIYTHWL